MVSKIKSKEYDKIIDEVTGEAMGEDEIRKFLDRPKIIRYSDLKKYDSLNQLLPKKKDYVIILYQNEQYSGHWTALLKNGNYLEYFDSYGGKIDDPLHWITINENLDLGIDAPFLTELIKKKGGKLYYNDRKMQEENENVSTCGRHCIFRIMNFLQNNRKIGPYIDLMDELKKFLKCTYDDIVSGFINDVALKM